MILWQVEKKEGRTNLYFPVGKRGDSGPYKLKIENELGFDVGVFDVCVQDRPSPPKGPLKVGPVYKDSAGLTWEAPEDDGGSDITNYIVEKRDTRSGTWVPVSNFVPGTSFTVPKLQEGHEYEFRVIAENAFGRSDPLTTEEPVLAKDPFSAPGKPGTPVATDHDRDHIDIAWTPPSDDGGAKISHYDVERMDVKTGRWIKINTAPVKGTSYHDTRVQDGHTYNYRVVAVNDAGPGAPSDPSKNITAKPMHEAPAFGLGIDGSEIKVRAGEPLDVYCPLSGSPVPEISWSNGPVPVLADARTQLEVDDAHCRLYIPVSKRSDSGPYRIHARNDNGSAVANVKVTVMDKPSEPEGPIEYPATRKDAIELKWRPPRDDGGCEITGYTVEMQELGSMKWEKVSDYIPSCGYTVRGLTEGKQYTFRIKAENFCGLSEPLTGLPVTAKDPFGIHPTLLLVLLCQVFNQCRLTCQILPAPRGRQM